MVYKHGPANPPNLEQEALQRAFGQADPYTQQGLGTSSWGGGPPGVWGDPPPQQGGGAPPGVWASGGGGGLPPSGQHTSGANTGAVPPITVSSQGQLPSTGSSVLESASAGLTAAPGNGVDPALAQQMQSFLANNPGDQGRMAQALGIDPAIVQQYLAGGGGQFTTGGPGGSSTPPPGVQMTTGGPGGSSTPPPGVQLYQSPGLIPADPGGAGHQPPGVPPHQMTTGGPGGSSTPPPGTQMYQPPGLLPAEPPPSAQLYVPPGLQPSGAMPPGWTFTGNRGPGNPSDAEIWDFLQRNPGDEHRVAEAFANITDPGLQPPTAPPGAPPTAPPDQPPPGVPPGVWFDPGGPGGIGPNGPGGPGGPNVPPNLRDLIGGLFTPQPPSPLQQQLTQGLQSLIQRGQTAPSLDDPNLAPVMDAYDRQQQRNAQRMRASLAERAAQTGTLNSGGFDTEALGYEADAGSNAAAFGADLVHGESTARRNELMQGLQLAQSIGDNESARELQRQISLLDASLQQAGMTQQGSQFAQDLALRRQLGIGDLDVRRELGRGDLDVRRLLGLGGLGVQNRGLDIQRELGLGDLGVRNRSIDLQGLLGAGDLDIRNRGLTQQGQLGRGSLAMQLFQSLMGNQQFYDQMGMSAAQWQALLNQSAIQQLFQGL